LIASNRQLRSHVIVWFLLVAGLVLAVTGYSIYQSAQYYLIQKIQHQQTVLAETTATLIDAKTHQRFVSENSMKTAAYQQYNDALLKIMKIDEFSSFIYTLNISPKNGEIRYGLIPNIRNEKNAVLNKAYTTGSKLVSSETFRQMVTRFYNNNSTATTTLLEVDSHHWDYISLAIIYDQKQIPVGVVVIEVSSRQIDSLKRDLLESMLVTISLLFISLLVAAIFFAHKITRPFDQLTDAVERLVKNDFNFNLSLSDFGGFVYLAKQFNLMLLKLQVSRNELVSTNKAYSRFVPHQVLKLISPNGIKSTNLGDCIEKEMTILFCDVRNFTKLSESMSPKENFTFINRYLKIMAPVINKYGGTIDKFMGDGIMALFPNSADNALNAAVSMMQSLSKYNKKLKANNLPIVKIGLGLHTGNMMLGTVGSSSRMDVTVISDTVNAAARIESLTKTFQTPILISEETRMRLDKFDKRNLRFIATCMVKGKSKPMTIYEVFTQDPVSVRTEKLNNQNAMIRAWEFYRQGDVERAVGEYQKLMEKSPTDKVLFALFEAVQIGRL